MKIGSGHRVVIPVKDILKYPSACLTNDLLSESDSTVLVPAHVPIKQLIESYEKPGDIINVFNDMGIQKIEATITQDLTLENLLDQLSVLDPSIKIVNPEVNEKALGLLKKIFLSLESDPGFVIPKAELEAIGQELSHEIRETSQIALSLVSAQEGYYAEAHMLNVALLCGYIVKRMAQTDQTEDNMIDKAILAGLLFDIGNAVLPKEITEKKGKLTSEELGVMRGHALESAHIGERAGITDTDILNGIRSHHERYDGSGYPQKLEGEEIPFIARLLAVTDTFDAMTTRRVHKGAVSTKASSSVIISSNETLFDPQICKVFLSGTGIYPPGTMVELSNGLFGTVVASTEGNLLQPKVAVNKDDGTPQVLNLTEARLFIRRSLDAQAAENPLDV
jgi:HD-GYP domain